MLDKNLKRLMDARNLVKDVRLDQYYTREATNIVEKACVAAEKSIEIAWELVEKEVYPAEERPA